MVYWVGVILNGLKEVHHTEHTQRKQRNLMTFVINLRFYKSMHGI